MTPRNETSSSSSASAALKEVTRELAARMLEIEQLKKSEARHRQLVEQVRDYSIFLLDTTGHVETWNLGAERLKGYRADEIIGKHFSVFYPKAHVYAGKCEFELTTAAADGSFEDEGWRVRRDGTLFWANVIITAIRGYDGSLRGFAKVTRDLTERRIQEEQLRKSEERLRLLVDQVQDYAIFMLSPEGTVISWNKGAQRLKGFVADEIIGKHFSTFYPPEEIAAGKCEHELRVANEVGRFEDEGWRVRKDGSRMWANVVISAIRDSNGALRGFAKVTRDLTDRRRAEESQRQVDVLRESERALLEFFETAPVGLSWIDPRGTITRCNRTELELLGYSESEYVGRPAREHHVDPEVADMFLAALASGEPVRDFESRLRHKDGSTRDVVISANGHHEGDRYVHSRCFTIDITARKAAEAALRDADRRKDEFLATLSHELRNPLAPVATALELIRRRGGDRPSLAGPIDVLDRQFKYLKRLVDDLLEVSRITGGKVRLERESVDAAALVGRAVEVSRPLMESRRHALEVALPRGPLLLDGDVTRLVQALSNILNNAAKYTPEGGKIRIAAAREGSEIVFRVRDNGVGIEASLMPRLFVLFSQADRSLDRSQGGLGIGLTLVRGLVELHGGAVTAHSGGIDQGSEFVVRLPAPVALPAATTGSSVSEKAASPSALKIAVVDDNVDNAEMLAALLAEMGHEVSVAHDGQAALTIVRDSRPRLVLLDLGLPILDGFEVARRLRAEHGGAFLLVALTGYGQEEDRRRVREAGFDHHVVKPLEIDVLMKLLARLQAPVAGDEGSTPSLSN